MGRLIRACIIEVDKRFPGFTAVLDLIDETLQSQQGRIWTYTIPVCHEIDNIPFLRFE